MIISASRRTDIPNYYSEWFFNRLKEGFVYVRNPMNPRQVSRIALSPDVVDCIVFWTKNPEPMISRLEELSAYQYYFQFTLTGYGADVEPNVPPKKEVMIPVFQNLSDIIGKERVIWRYDPIFFTPKYMPEYHIRAFGQIAGALAGYTDKCVISFVDEYAKNRKKLAAMGTYELNPSDLLKFARKINGIAASCDMETGSCAERIDLAECGIVHNCCIDQTLIERLIGCKINAGKDKSQRPECGCVESVEIGAYDTCPNGCVYCYANGHPERVIERCQNCDPVSPLLGGTFLETDHISARDMKSIKREQMTFFDIDI